MADIPQRKQSVKELDEARQRKVMETVARRASFYRANPHRFASEYLGLTLKLFQQIIIYLMNFETNFMYLAARGRHFHDDVLS